jgi:hypothetical protein
MDRINLIDFFKLALSGFGTSDCFKAFESQLFSCKPYGVFVASSHFETYICSS